MKRTSKTRRKLRRRKRGGNGNKISSPQLTRRKRSNLLWLISPAYRRLSSKIDKAKRRKGVIQQVQKEAKARGLIISKRQIREDLKTLPQNMQHHSDHLLDVYLTQAEQAASRGRERGNKTRRGGRRRRGGGRRRHRRTRKQRGGWFGSNWFSGVFGTWGKKTKKGAIPGSWTSQGMRCNPALLPQCPGGLKCVKSGFAIGPLSQGKCM